MGRSRPSRAELHLRAMVTRSRRWAQQVDPYQTRRSAPGFRSVAIILPLPASEVRCPRALTRAARYRGKSKVRKDRRGERQGIGEASDKDDRRPEREKATAPLAALSLHGSRTQKRAAAAGSALARNLLGFVVSGSPGHVLTLRCCGRPFDPARRFWWGRCERSRPEPLGYALLEQVTLQ